MLSGDFYIIVFRASLLNGPNHMKSFYGSLFLFCVGMSTHKISSANSMIEPTPRRVRQHAKMTQVVPDPQMLSTRSPIATSIGKVTLKRETTLSVPYSPNTIQRRISVTLSGKMPKKQSHKKGERIKTLFQNHQLSDQNVLLNSSRPMPSGLNFLAASREEARVTGGGTGILGLCKRGFVCTGAVGLLIFTPFICSGDISLDIITIIVKLKQLLPKRRFS